MVFKHGSYDELDMFNSTIQEDKINRRIELYRELISGDYSLDD